MADEKKEAAEVVALTKKDPNGVELLDITKLEPAIKKQVVGLVQELNDNMQAVATSYLKMGSTLKRAQDLLSPLKCFQAFVNNIPGMSLATAYRYIRAFEQADKVLPNAILTRALAANLDIVSPNADIPYGKYQKAVERVGIPEGNVTDTQARKWISDVVVEQKLLSSKQKKEEKVNVESINQRNIFRSVIQNYHRLPAEKQTVAWLRDCFGYALKELGFTAPMTVQPAQNVPDYIRGPQVEKKKAGRPRKQKKAKSENTPAVPASK